MSLLEDILQEVLYMDDNERKNLLRYIRTERYTEMYVPSVKFDIQEMDYLQGLSDEALDFVKMVLENYNLNLYHSAGSIIKGNYGYTLQEKFDYYMSKYQQKRPWMKGNEKILKEIFNHVCKKLGRKDLLPKSPLNLVK